MPYLPVIHGKLIIWTLSVPFYKVCLVYIIPPTEANTQNLWKLNTAVYGLVDESRTWYLKVENELNTLKLKRAYMTTLCFIGIMKILFKVLCAVMLMISSIVEVSCFIQVSFNHSLPWCTLELT